MDEASHARKRGRTWASKRTELGIATLRTTGLTSLLGIQVPQHDVSWCAGSSESSEDKIRGKACHPVTTLHTRQSNHSPASVTRAQHAQHELSRFTTVAAAAASPATAGVRGWRPWTRGQPRPFDFGQR